MEQQTVRVEPDLAAIDTVEGLRASIVSFEAFSETLRARARAAAAYHAQPFGSNTLPPPLHNFLLLGRYWLDALGQVLTSQHKLPVSAPVIRKDDYTGSATYGHRPIALAGDRCGLCERPFTLETAHEAHVTLARGDALEHKRCAWMANAQEARDHTTSIVERAGFKPFYIADVENGYWPDGYKNETFYTPWHRVTTPELVFTIGLRKRVLHIDWSETSDVRLTLPEGDNVTEGAGYVHAWSGAKAVEYLRLLRQTLESRGAS